MSKNRKAQEVDVIVGQRIRARRMICGLSQAKLGAKLGITFQQIQKYEKGTNRVSAGALYVIAETLGVPVSYFFDESPQAMGPLETSLVSEPGGAELSRVFLALPRIARTCLLDAGRMMLTVATEEGGRRP